MDLIKITAPVDCQLPLPIQLFKNLLFFFKKEESASYSTSPSTASPILPGDPVRPGHSGQTNDPAIHLPAAQHSQRPQDPHVGVLPQQIRSSVPRSTD